MSSVRGVSMRSPFRARATGYGAGRYVAPAVAGAAQRSWLRDADLPVVYLLVFASLFLPFIRFEWDTLRWVCLLAVALPWVLINLGRVFKPAIPRGLLLLLLATVLLRVASTLWSPLRGYTAMRSISLTVLFVFLFAFCTRVVVHGRLRLVAYVIALITAVCIIPGVVLWAAGYTLVPISGFELWKGQRFSGILMNPNQIGVCVAVCLPLVTALWWERKRRLWLVVLIAACLLSLVYAESRAGMLGTVLGIATFFAVGWRVRWFVVLGGFALFLGWLAINLSHDLELAAFSYATHRDPTYLRDNPDEISVQRVAATRLRQWLPGWRLVKQRPILGQGYGVGGTGARAAGGQEFGYALHNSYLQVWQENGLVGLLLLAAIVLVVLWRILKSFAIPKSLPTSLLWAGLAGSCVGGLADCFFESWLLSVGNLGTLPFWTIVMLLCSAPPTMSYMAARR